MTKASIFIRFFALAFLVVSFSASKAIAAINIQDVTSEAGISAWLVEDYSVPIVTVKFSFGAGTAQDMPGKEGTVNLITGLLDEGAGSLDSDAFQELLDLTGAEISFSAGVERFSGSMRVLRDDLEKAIDLLTMAINEPRFDEKPLNRIRGQIITGIRSEQSDPTYLAGRLWSEKVWGDHPYGATDSGSEESLNSVTREDLEAARSKIFVQEGLKIGVVGAISADETKAMLDEIFSDLPQSADQKKVPDTEPNFGLSFNYSYDLPQTNIQIVYPGISREDPKFFDAYLMTHIFGGGSFSSRLYKSVREERGLTYSVGAYLASREHANGLYISTSTRKDRVGETLTVLKDEIEKMIADGVTDEELAKAKSYIKGSYAVRNLTNSSSIASTMVGLQEIDLGIDYINRRSEYIDGVTKEGVLAAARSLLDAKPTIMIVGNDVEENPFQ